MNEMIVVVLAFAILLGLEWRFRWRIVRVGTAVLAVLMLWFVEPDPTAATRRAFSTPPAERVTHRFGSPISEYSSGVRTMARAMRELERRSVPPRLLGYGALLWLACSPALRSPSERDVASDDAPLAEGGS